MSKVIWPADAVSPSRGASRGATATGSEAAALRSAGNITPKARHNTRHVSRTFSQNSTGGWSLVAGKEGPIGWRCTLTFYADAAPLHQCVIFDRAMSAWIAGRSSLDA